MVVASLRELPVQALLPWVSALFSLCPPLPVYWIASHLHPGAWPPCQLLRACAAGCFAPSRLAESCPGVVTQEPSLCQHVQQMLPGQRDSRRAQGQQQQGRSGRALGRPTAHHRRPGLS